MPVPKTDDGAIAGRHMQHRAIEYRSLASPFDLTANLTEDLRKATSLGAAVIIVDRAAIFYAVLKRRWKKLQRQQMIERARTLDPDKIMNFSRELLRMREMVFTVHPKQDPNALVTLADPHQFTEHVRDCRTLYICHKMPHAAYERVTQALPANARIVIYDFTSHPGT